MKRYKKKDLLQTVSMLTKVNDSIGRAASSTVLFEMEEEFIKCQEAAVDLGSYLETLDMDYAPMVRILEYYCEHIYQLSTNIQDESQCKKLSKKIRKQLIQLQNAITYDMPPDKKEVVFLPYKAAMWDSLESVWQAAREDENCDAYVIPIPYYDKNPDGSFREMHYEADQYPDYVPITRYDAFDFEAHRPDAIYIHNAYDNCNLVTSVHPFFYSSNLKKFTERLVYIPYFMLGEIKPYDNARIDSIKHFCTLPGIINADKVIVQSEDMRQIYIKVLMDVMNTHSEMDRKYWMDKILGLGSPKLDKVVDIRRENIKIPDDWFDIIRRPDGSWKKVIFYNTSIAGLLQYNEKMLDKMKFVFHIFKENRNEVALLWRPHPLIRATVESMRPQLWEEYSKIVSKYCEEKWGIYDDTADVHRAIKISDAYYGDGSSVVQLYQQMGKPVMIQSVDIVL